MEPLTVTDAARNDIAHILDYNLDLAYGSDEQSFSLYFGLEPRLEVGALVYIDGTEYGGIVDGVKSDTVDNELTYIGRSWTGILAAKIIMPPSGSGYYTVSGDANECIRQVLARLDVSDLFQASAAVSGVTVNNYSFERFVDAYTGLRAMLKASGAKLRMLNEQGRVIVSAAPIEAYSDTVDDNLMDFSAQRNWRTVNHLVCMGEGELADRTVFHVYADGDGNVSQTQTFFGLDEIAATYDYNNADDGKLLESGLKKLQEMQSEGEIKATINTSSVDVGDVLTATDNALNLSVTAEVTKKIVRTNKGVLESSYETGAESSPVSTIHTGGDSSPGGGTVYTAGPGIDITSGIISADVTQSELDSVASTASSAASTASGAASTANAASAAVTALDNSLSAVAKSGNYNDLSNTPSIPTATSDLTNDSNFVSDASYVHTDNNFTSTEKSKLSGIAAGAEVNVQSDWNITSSTSDAYIKNKPTIPSATSQLTNDSGFITSAAVPTATSDLTNDSGYITASDIPTATSSALGMVKPDNTSITINDGTISAVGGVPVGLADVAYSGEYSDLLNTPEIIRPYAAGDSIPIALDTAGYVTSGSSHVRFVIPLCKPISSGVSATLTYGSGEGYVLRQNASYTHGSGAGSYVIPTTTVAVPHEGFVYIDATFSRTTNAQNNAAIGINCNGTLTFS